ncbi:TIGR02450 family Trp-rich protein [Synechococcus sp. CCY 9618]|uniref:TIGR02450 family Trp-rich protein n=1 Tax=Synechococcus sp. CCY 9618 TaxID=2815602 RepID=UPI001C237D19|nr:TIGR02450 family Trp-rich protein [Synechococcus sp. CCY 9618]
MKLPAAWTAQPAQADRNGGYRHFALVGIRGKRKERSAELEAVLARGFRLLIPLDELFDRAAWLPGWQPLPPRPPDAEDQA